MHHDTLSRLIGRIYDAATDVSGWPAFLTDLSTELGAVAAGLLQHEVRPSGVEGLVTAATAVDPVSAQLYGTHFGALDPWAIVLARQKRLDTDFLVTSESLVSFDQLRRTEYYNEYARRFDYVRNVGLGVATDPGVATTVTVIRGERMKPFGSAEVSVMGALQPHVGRALRVHSRLSGALRDSFALGKVLDRLQTGVVLLAGSGRILFANKMARAIAEARDGFRLDIDGPRASDVRDTRALRGLLSAAADPTQRGGGVMRLSRPSLKQPLVVFVSPLTNAASMGLAERSLVVLFLSDPEIGPDLDPKILKSTYGLAPAEAEIARSLARGATLSEIASRHKLTVNSTRWYVKQILHKTGSKSQVDLLKQLLAGPAAVLPPDSEAP